MAANFFFFFYLEAVRVRSEREHPHPPAFAPVRAALQHRQGGKKANFHLQLSPSCCAGSWMSGGAKGRSSKSGEA